MQGRLAAGHPDHAPYDLVLIEGAVRGIPEALGRQVGENGRLVTVLWPVGQASCAVLAEPSTGGLRAQAEFDAGAPLLTPLVTADAFTF
jgi:protein-L-isoaspartate(D-aspartate) O-methyltransferase